MANVAPQVLQVYVLNEIVNPPNPKIPNQGMLVLINQDLNFYRVQLALVGADDHTPIYGVRPPLGRLMIMGGPDPGDQNTQCNFELFVTDMTKPLPTQSSGKP